MKTLREYITLAEENKVAIGHFNFATLDMLWAIFNAAKELSTEIEHPFGSEGIPVVVGLAEEERKYVGVEAAAILIKNLRQEHGYPIFLNADHTYSVDLVKEAIDAGYDSVIYDGNKETVEENVEHTKQVVAYRNAKNPACLVEAELGFIGMGSVVRDTIPEGVSSETMTKPEEAQKFVQATGIDLLAPSVGNIHGMVKGGDPALDASRVAAIRQACGIPLVLHGGSGSSDQDFVKVIDAGISLVHISTELRVAYHDTLVKTIGELDALQPYKYLAPSRDAVKEIAKARMRLFIEKKL